MTFASVTWLVGRNRRAWRPLLPIVLAAVLVGAWGTATQMVASATGHARSVATQREHLAAERSASVRYLELGDLTVVRIISTGSGLASDQVLVSDAGAQVMATEPRLAALLGRPEATVGLPDWVAELPGEVVVIEPANEVSGGDSGLVSAPGDGSLATLRSTILLAQAALLVPALSMLFATIGGVRTRRAPRNQILNMIGVDSRSVRRADMAAYVAAAAVGASTGTAATLLAMPAAGVISLGRLRIDPVTGSNFWSIVAPVVVAMALAAVAANRPARRSRRPRWQPRWRFIAAPAVTVVALAILWNLGQNRSDPPLSSWALTTASALGVLVVSNPMFTRTVVWGIGGLLGRTRIGIVAGARLVRRPQLFDAVAAAIAIQVAFTFLVAGLQVGTDPTPNRSKVDVVVRIIDTEERGGELTTQLLDQLAPTSPGTSVINYSYVTINGSAMATVASAPCPDLVAITDLDPAECFAGRAWPVGHSSDAGTVTLTPATQPTQRNLAGTFEVRSPEVTLLSSGDQPVYVVAGDFIGATRELQLSSASDTVLADIVTVLDTAPSDVATLHLAEDLQAKIRGADDPNAPLLYLAAAAMALLLGVGVAASSATMLRTLARERAIEWALGRPARATRLDQSLMMATTTLAASLIASTTGLVAGSLFAGHTPSPAVIAGIITASAILTPIAAAAGLILGRATSPTHTVATLRSD